MQLAAKSTVKTKFHDGNFDPLVVGSDRRTIFSIVPALRLWCVAFDLVLRIVPTIVPSLAGVPSPNCGD